MSVTSVVMPQRLQLSRRAGWKKPEGAVVVSRPTRWGNPYPLPPMRKTARGARRRMLREELSRAIVARYRNALVRGDLGVTVGDVREHLRGKDLLCWCRAGRACHADVLLEIANSTGPVSSG